MPIETKLLKKECLPLLFQKIKGAGQKIVAPVVEKEHTRFQEIDSPTQMAQNYIQTTQSAKEAVFPKVEEIFSYRNQGGKVEIKEKVRDEAPLVLFGLRPCDAASFSILEAVFDGDFKDKLFLERMKKVTVVALSCSKADSYCFCTSVGLGPGDTKGSDLLLTELPEGDFIAEIITTKGEALVALDASLFVSAPADVKKEEHIANVACCFDLEEIRKKLPEHYAQEGKWTEMSLRCLGCGACAFVCPVCTCFDIQDEKHGCSGKRLRCWDSCGFALFTLHTSGHNPKPKQKERWRQRIMHKFSYEAEQLGVVGCVGCGRCSRACPVDMNLSEHLQSLTEKKQC